MRAFYFLFQAQSRNETSGMGEAEKPQRSFFFQPTMSRANSVENEEHRTTSVNQTTLALNFGSLSTEGEHLMKQGDYERAILSFNKAMEIKPGDRLMLVLRSRCNMLLGRNELAIKDANRALEADKSYFRAILQKAQSHFFAGDFEMALVFYHRGARVRPDMEEFRLGIQKSQEAIEEAIYDTVKSKDSQPNASLSRKAAPGDESIRSRKGPVSQLKQTESVCSTPTLKKQGQEGQTIGEMKPKSSRARTAPSINHEYEWHSTEKSRNSRRVLGKLSTDKMYLELLAKEQDPLKKGGIQKLAQIGLVYLDKREDFWRQHNTNESGTPLPHNTRSLTDSPLDKTHGSARSARKPLPLTVSQGARAATVPTNESDHGPMILPPISGSKQHPKSAGNIGMAGVGGGEMDFPTADWGNKTSDPLNQSNVTERDSPQPGGMSRKQAEMKEKMKQFGTKNYVKDTHFCLQQFQHIEHAINTRDGETSVRFALDVLERMGTLCITDKVKVTMRLLVYMAQGYNLASKFPQAAVYGRLSLQMAMEYKDTPKVIKSLESLGVALQSLGEFKGALEAFDNLLRLHATEVESPEIYLRMAQCYRSMRSMTRAMDYSDLCIKWIEKHEKPDGEAQSLPRDVEIQYTKYRLQVAKLIASSLDEAGKWREAGLRYDAGLLLARKIQDIEWETDILNLLIELYTNSTEPDKATVYQQQLNALKKKERNG